MEAKKASVIVTGANPPKDARDLRVRMLLARMVQEAEPVPKNYRPDETVTEDGSRPQPSLLPRRPLSISTQRKLQNTFGELEAQEFLDRQRRRTTTRKLDAGAGRSTRFGEAKTTQVQQQNTADGKLEKGSSLERKYDARANYLEPEWAGGPSQRFILRGYEQQKLKAEVSLETKRFYMVGRLPDCDIVIKHASVSKYHAIIQHGEDGVYIFDLGSTNGTFVNDRQKLQDEGRLPKRQYKRILADDLIMFGDYTVQYMLVGGIPRLQFEQCRAQRRTTAFRGNRDRDRDYHLTKDGARKDIQSARNHFRERFRKMQNRTR